MLLGIDHIVILVSTLDQAMADYRALGFTVNFGGEHTGGATHNALVSFPDNSYLELIAFKREEPGHRWWKHVVTGGGLIDYALLPGAIAEDIAVAKARGVVYDGPTSGGRLRPDGQQVAWQNGMPPSPDLPFLCGDVTPRVLRVPDGAAWQHANGAQGIAGVTVAVADRAKVAAHYQALLGVNPTLAETPDALTAVFPLASGTITVAQPRTASSALADRLTTVGEGIFALFLRPAPDATPPPFNPALTQNARLAWAKS